MGYGRDALCPGWQPDTFRLVKNGVQTVRLPSHLTRAPVCAAITIGANSTSAAQPDKTRLATNESKGANVVVSAQPGDCGGELAAGARCKRRCYRPGWRQVAGKYKSYEGVVNACLWVTNLTHIPKDG
jgi:hypothetical protein